MAGSRQVLPLWVGHIGMEEKEGSAVTLRCQPEPWEPWLT